MSKHFSIGICLTLPFFLLLIFLLLGFNDKIYIINGTSLYQLLETNQALKVHDGIIYLDISRISIGMKHYPFLLVLCSTLLYSKFATVRHKNKFAEDRKYLSEVIQRARQEGKREAQKEISLQLHHSVCGALTAAIFHLETNLIKNPSNPIRNAKTLLKEASHKIRLLSHNIQATNNLHNSIQKIIQLYSNEGLKISYSIDDNINASEYLNEKELISIIEELAQNVIKHSQASEFTIVINIKQNNLCVTVDDNGIGFHTNTIYGFGLSNINRVLIEHQGGLKISNHKTNGASVTVSFPTKK